MTEWAVSTNLISFVPARAQRPMFGWPMDGPEAQVINTMEPGDLIVPKFAQAPGFGKDGQVDYQRGICEVLELDFDQQVYDYNTIVAGGKGAVPYVWHVTARLPDDSAFPSSAPWACVAIEVEELPHSLSTQEFLRLRVIPAKLARQFKAMAAPGRRIQELRAGTVQAIRESAQSPDRTDALRKYSVVWAESIEEAVEKLGAVGRPLTTGDQCFLASDARMLGLYEASNRDVRPASGEVINMQPSDLLSLFEAAKARRKNEDSFRPMHPLAAAKSLVALIESDDSVLAVDDFATFHDRYALLARRVNEALVIAADEEPAEGAAPGEDPPESEEATGAEEDELAKLQGLDVAAVEAALPGDVEFPKAVLAEAVTALRSGKHLLLSGPPGTGKSTLATALCRAVMEDQFDVVTATADWTTFDTIGGYLPTEKGTLGFEPGVVPRCLKAGRWLVIDELNRADIDKAFGPLFSLLAGTGVDTPVASIALPFQRDGHPVSIDWARARWEGTGDFTVTPAWRLLGTLNVSDKASLFQLSFAFLRRFAVVDVPLPPAETYRVWFDAQCEHMPSDVRQRVVDASMRLAFAKRQLGPAILKDVARFLRVGLTQTSSGEPSYTDAVDAYLTAVRLYAAPQYEGAGRSEVEEALSILSETWASPPERSWEALASALYSLALA